MPLVWTIDQVIIFAADALYALAVPSEARRFNVSGIHV
jgi:hypothetical protein